MTEITTTTVKPIDRATVVAPMLEAAIDKASDLALVAGLLQTGVRLTGRSLDELETMAATASKVIEGEPLAALLAVAHQIDPRTHVVTEAQTIWTMDWSGTNPDGSRRHPDKPDTEEIFEERQGLALLLINEVVHLNSHHWMDAWPAEARRTLHLGVDCSDVFVWGCADSEDAVHADIESVYRHWVKDPQWGPAVWSMIRRRQMPQRPVEKRIRDAGIWDIDALRAEHDLRANHYDSISGVTAGQKYEAYSAWEHRHGIEPMPYDARWWEGWRRFVAANPDWHDDAWKTEEATRTSNWRNENGYGDGTPIAATPEIDIAVTAGRLANMLESAAERRGAAARAADDSARSYLLHQAAASERRIIEALPALLAAIRAQGGQA